MKKNPKALLLTSRNIDYDDCEFEVSGISYYYIIPAGKLKEQQIEFKNEVDKQIKKGIKNKGTIGAMMLDMNGFKNINDTYSHSDGDQALISVAKILKKVVRFISSINIY